MKLSKSLFTSFAKAIILLFISGGMFFACSSKSDSQQSGDTQSEVGGWDNYATIHRPGNWDTDSDGMPDEWEKKNGLDPNNPDDRNRDINNNGYTNLETYINSLVPAQVF